MKLFDTVYKVDKYLFCEPRYSISKSLLIFNKH